MALKPAGVRGYEHTPAAAAVDSGVEQCSRVRISEPDSCRAGYRWNSEPGQVMAWAMPVAGGPAAAAARAVVNNTSHALWTDGM